jgi:hypothetical protein
VIRCIPIAQPEAEAGAETEAVRTVDGDEALLPLVVDAEVGVEAEARVEHDRSRRRRRLQVSLV